MTSILAAGDDAALVHEFAYSLDRAGHRVELAADMFRARDRLAGEPCDLVVVDARWPDCGTGLLIAQARAAWPCCRVVALVERRDLRRTKVHEMGLWTPDEVLVHPVPGDELVRAVCGLSPRREAPVAGMRAAL